jgi:hypothetical protein
MGQSYSSMKPINRVYNHFMNSLYHDINTIDDPEFTKDLLGELRKALNHISDDYIHEHIAPQLDMSPIPNRPQLDIQSRLCQYYMKKILFAISARSYFREVVKIDPEHPDAKRYRKILGALVTKTKSSVRDRNGRVKTRIIYSDKQLSETELERMYALYFDAIYMKHPTTNKFDEETPEEEDE